MFHYFLQANGRQPPNQLMVLQGTIVELKKCTFGKNHLFYPEQFCVKRYASGDGICDGDSGGPVVDKKGLLVGVIVASSPKPDCTYYDYMMNVANYKVWIEKKITNNF